MNIIEEYKPIEGYNNKYYISNTGKVFVTDYRGHKVWSEMKTRLIKGYLAVGLRKFDGKKSIQTIYKIHRLVATYFIPNPKNKPVVNHIDGNKLNNIVTNLEWATVGENTRHAYRNKLEYTWWNKELAIQAINLIENYNYGYNDVAKLFKIPSTCRSGAYSSVRNLYERGYRTFLLKVKYFHIEQKNTLKPLSQQYINYINKLLQDNIVLNIECKSSLQCNEQKLKLH